MRPQVAKQIPASGIRGWVAEVSAFIVTVALMVVMGLIEGFQLWSYEGMALLATIIYGAAYLGILMFFERYGP
jgi:type III secretory pathway component EscV